MRPADLVFWAVLVGATPGWAADAPVRPTEHATADAAARILSVHPRGQLPQDPAILDAVSTLADRGTRRDVSLLADIVEHEHPQLAGQAREAIRAIRERQRASQMRDFERQVLHRRAPAETSRHTDLGPAEAACVRYAQQVLGTEAPRHQALAPELAASLLDAGRAGEAVTAADPITQPRLAALALEHAGDVRSALRIQARLAATGDEQASQALSDYGVDPERLLLGLLHSGSVDDAQALEILVRRGHRLTVQVLAERVHHPDASEQATAADALGRMLTVALRSEPLPHEGRELARKALIDAARTAEPAVRPIAIEALRDDTP